VWNFEPGAVARVTMMRTPTTIPSRSEYYRLAEQFEQLALAATYEPERRGLKARGELFRKLGDARLDTNGRERRFRQKKKVRGKEKKNAA
jgi:hypothetical protein